MDNLCALGEAMQMHERSERTKNWKINKTKFNFNENNIDTKMRKRNNRRRSENDREAKSNAVWIQSEETTVIHVTKTVPVFMLTHSSRCLTLLWRLDVSRLDQAYAPLHICTSCFWDGNLHVAPLTVPPLVCLSILIHIYILLTWHSSFFLLFLSDLHISLSLSSGLADSVYLSSLKIVYLINPNIWITQ